MNESTAELVSDLVDLDRVSLAALDSYEEATLAPALTSLLRQVDAPVSTVGGHNS